MRIALIGKMFSGKTTAADYLKENYNFTQFSFGDGVKETAALLLNTFAVQEGGTPDWDIDKINENKSNPIVRHLLQFIGGEVGRQLVGTETIWTDKVLDKIAALEVRRPGANIVIDDCRYENEFDILKAAGFRMVRIQRRDLDRISMMQKRYPDTWESVAMHPSETSLDNHQADVVISVQSVKALHRALDTLIH